jgi:hypothetical protein
MLLSILPILLPLPKADAAAATWDGGGANSNWSTGANWVGDVAPPANGTASIRFSGTAKLTMNVDLNNPWNISDIAFNGGQAVGSYVISGNPLTLNAGGALTIQDTAVAPQTINNALTFNAPSTTVWLGLNRRIIAGGAWNSGNPLFILGGGNPGCVLEITATGSINVGSLEVSAMNAYASASQGPTLQLDHANALANTLTLKLTPKADLSKYPKVNLAFSGTETVAGLVLNGVTQPAGTYNATTHPSYFTGAGNLAVGSSTQVITSGLVYNFDPAGSGATAATWTSQSPGSNTTKQFNTSGAEIVRITNPDPSATTAVNGAYHFTTASVATATPFTDVGFDSTLEFWIKPDSFGGEHQVIWENGSVGAGMALLLFDNTLTFTGKTGGNISANPQVILSHTFNEKDANDFIQVVVTCDSVGGFKMFVNPLGEMTPDAPKATLGTFFDCRYGGADGSGLGGQNGSIGSLSNTGGGNLWNGGLWKRYAGSVGNIRFYNRVLTPAEVRQNYLAVTGRNAANATPITQYAEWGPNWGRGGLARFYMNSEGTMSPQPGDMDNNNGLFGGGSFEWRSVTAAANGFLDFKDATKFPRIAEWGSSRAYGTAEQLHFYVKASDTTATTGIFYITSNPNYHQLWVNGASVAKGELVTLNAGWNRVMLRAVSDADNARFGSGWAKPWNIQVALGSGSGGTLSGLQFRIDDPQRKVLVTDDQRNFRYLTSLKRIVDGDQPIFVRGEQVDLDYTVRVALGTGPNYQIPYTPQPTNDMDRSRNLPGLNWVYSVDPAQVVLGNPAWTTVPAGEAWVSSAPASDTVRFWNTSNPALSLIKTPDPSPATAINAAYQLNGNAALTTTQFASVGAEATFEIWVKPDALTNGKQVLFEDGGQSYGISLLLNSGTAIFAVKSTGSTSGGPNVALQSVMNASQISDFVQIVGVTTSTGTALYVNGVSEAAPATAKVTGASGGNWTLQNNGAGLGGRNVNLGASTAAGGSFWTDGTWVPFKGKVGWMRVYNRGLTGSEVAQNFNAIAKNTGGPVTSGLLYNWNATTSTNPGTWAQYAPNRVNIQILNSADQVVLNQTTNLAFGGISNGEISAGVDLNLGALGVDHYRVFTHLIDPSGKVQVRNRVHSFSVLLGPVDRTKDQKPRLMGSYYEWFTEIGDAQVASKLRWLNRVGMTKQQGLYDSWTAWGMNHDGAGNVSITTAPRIDFALATAASLNIDVIGQLAEGYYKEFVFGQRISNLYEGDVQFYPAYGTAAWDNTFTQYATLLVNRYKDRIKIWGGKNEIDLGMDQSDHAAEVHAAATAKMWAGVQAADPTAIYLKSSLVRSNSTTPNLKNHGFLNYGQATDVHSHPGIAPSLHWDNLGEGSNEGRSMLLAFRYTGGVWFGEINAPESRNYWGALGSAGDIIKQMAWAVNLRDVSNAPVQGMMYLTAYNDDVVWSYNDGFNNQMGDPLPQVNAANVANHWIDGRNVLAPLADMPIGVEHIRVDVANLDPSYPQAVVVWNDGNNLWLNGINATRSVTFNVTGANVKVVNYLGQESTLTATNGKVTVKAGPMPLILRGTFN